MEMRANDFQTAAGERAYIDQKMDAHNQDPTAHGDLRQEMAQLTETVTKATAKAMEAADAAKEAAEKADVAGEDAERATEEAIAAAQEAENSGLVAKKTADDAALDAETRVGNAVATAVAAAQNARDSANEASALVMEAERDLTEFNKQAETAINGVRGAEQTAEQAASAAQEAAERVNAAIENAEQATEEALAAAQEAENSGLAAKKTADDAAETAEQAASAAEEAAERVNAAIENAEQATEEAIAAAQEAENSGLAAKKTADDAAETAEQAASAAQEAATLADVARENAEQATEEAIAAAEEARETAESFSIHSESETGKAYQITDSADGHILGLSLYGESNQNTEITDSKNLCRLETGTWTEGNVTVTYNADTGFFTFKGDNVSAGTMMYIPLADLIPMNSTVGSLTLSIHDVSGTGGQLSIESHSGDQIYFVSSLTYPDNSCATETYAGEDYNLNKLYMCAFSNGAYDYQFRIQIEQGSTANDWQLPNGSYTLTPDTPIDVISVENPTVTVGGQTVTLEGITLRGLKDSAGNRVARDEVVADVEKGTVKLIQRVAVEDVTSNPRFGSVGKSDAIRSYTLFTTYNVKKSGILSSILPFYAVENWQNNMECIYFGDYNIQVNIFLSRLDSALTSGQAILKWVDELVASGVQWLVFYEMETPIETDITETEAGQALLALHTSYPETALISDGDCMIRYVADTSNAFNKLKDKNVALEERIAALENSIVNQE